MDRRSLERTLEGVEGFSTPDPALEQYVTDPSVAAHLLYRAMLAGDIRGRTVVDLGAGTGLLAIGAALLDAQRVIALERDPIAIRSGVENARKADVSVRIHWLEGDVTALPLSVEDATVIANPPFGAQRGHSGADRPFLEAAAGCGRVAYTIHNEGSREFLERFVPKLGGVIEEAFAVQLDVDRQFPFHEQDTKTIPAEAYRIRWS